MLEYKNISVIILSAGESKRLGKPKALLKFNTDETFVEKIVKSYSELGIDDILIVANNKLKNHLADLFVDKPYKPKIIINNSTEKGRLYSIQCGAKTVKSKNCFIHNVDNPFVDKHLVEKMIPLLKYKSYTQAVYNGKGGHPVLLSKEIIEFISGIRDYDISLKDVLMNYNRIVIKTDNSQILTNINTIEDYNLINS